MKKKNKRKIKNSQKIAIYSLIALIIIVITALLILGILNQNTSNSIARISFYN